MFTSFAFSFSGKLRRKLNPTKNLRILQLRSIFDMSLKTFNAMLYNLVTFLISAKTFSKVQVLSDKSFF